MVTDTNQKKILIVDDERIVRRTIRKTLAREGYDCVEAGNSLEALEQLKGTGPDLVILDIMMPGKSGRELLPEIMADYPGVATIMATAVADPKTIIECMKSGAQDYITKPFNPEDVVKSVDSALEMKQLESKIGEYHRQLEHTVDDQKKQIRDIFLNSIEALVSALEAKDKYTDIPGGSR